MALHSHLIHCAQNWKNLYFSFFEVNDSSSKMRGLSNEEKIALSKQKLRQASYTVEDELKKKKTLHVTLDLGDYGRYKNLKLVQLGE
jgi:hypothetical protein